MNNDRIFLTHTYNGYIGSYIPGKYPIISYAPCNMFVSFVEGIKEKYPELKQTYIVDDRIAKQIENKIVFDKINRGREND